MLRAIDETVSGEVGGQFSLKREWDVASEHVWDAPARQSTAASVSAREGPVLERGEIIW